MSFWSKLTGSQKQTVLILGLFSGASLVVVGVYTAGKPPKPAEVVYKKPQEAIDLGPEHTKLIKRTERDDLEGKLAKKEEELKALAEREKEKQSEADVVWEQKAKEVSARPAASTPPAKPEEPAVKPQPPLPPVQQAGLPFPRPPQPSLPQGRGGQPQGQAAPQAVFKGGIGVLGGLGGGKDARPADVKKKRKIRIPTGSFMDATILTGVYAPTTKDGRSDSVPILFRVSTPAQLPNEVKTSLKGCFAIGNAIGALKDERVHVEILRLSCVSKNQRSLIDQAIVAYVSDSSDGMEGVRGEVMAKLEKPLLRTVIAGFFKGVGDVVKASSSTTSISALGQTSSIDPSQVAQGGIGAAVSTAADKLQEFYLHLAEMSMPVVGVKAGRDVSIILRQGVDLDLQSLCAEGDDECTEE